MYKYNTYVDIYIYIYQHTYLPYIHTYIHIHYAYRYNIYIYIHIRTYRDAYTDRTGKHVNTRMRLIKILYQGNIDYLNLVPGDHNLHLSSREIPRQLAQVCWCHGHNDESCGLRRVLWADQHPGGQVPSRSTPTQSLKPRIRKPK